jgi:hypothetical protein
MTGRVFIPQLPTRRDRSTGQIVQAADLSDAERFGRLVYLLSPTARPFDRDRRHGDVPATLIHEMTQKLDGFCDQDALLLSGSPVFIGAATAIAAQTNCGRVRLLQWDRRRSRYFEIQLVL